MDKSLEVARVVMRFRALIREMAMRDIKDRYLDHALGAVWAILSPLLAIMVYVYLFTQIFPSRIGDDPSSLKAIAWLLTGLVVWFFITDVMGRSVTVVSQSPALVQRVIFPVEIIPMQCLLVALPNLFIGLVIIVLLQIVHEPTTLIGALLLLPLALIILAAHLVGIAYLLAGLGPFLKDLKEIVQFFSMVGMFIAPVIYLPSTLSQLNPLIGGLLAINPFTHVIACFRDALYFGAMTEPTAWVLASLFGLAVSWIGTTIYQRVKPHFAEAL